MYAGAQTHSVSLHTVCIPSAPSWQPPDSFSRPVYHIYLTACAFKPTIRKRTAGVKQNTDCTSRTIQLLAVSHYLQLWSCAFARMPEAPSHHRRHTAMRTHCRKRSAYLHTPKYTRVQRKALFPSQEKPQPSADPYTAHRQRMPNTWLLLLTCRRSSCRAGPSPRRRC